MENRNWRKVAYQLWRLIDNIDTASDVAKGNLEAYRSIVERQQARRWSILAEKDVKALYEDFHPTEPERAKLA